MTFPTFLPAGDAAILVTFGERIELATNRRAHALARRLAQQPPAGFIESAPGYASLLVHYDPLLLDYPAALASLQALCAAAGESGTELPARRVEIPVRYGGEDGPDLEDVARHAGLSLAEVVRIHTAGEYPVYFLGFTTGFPYLGGLDGRIACPRLATPRQNVPGGSVGIGGTQTGIYPVTSPGGWRIIGRTPLALFSADHTPPALLEPGDVVIFTAIG